MANDQVMTAEQVIDCTKSYLNDENVELVKKAYEFARQAHHDQFRKSGEPYIIHPIQVAGILADLETAFVGGSLEVWPEIESTNARARRLAEEGAPEGTVVITDFQTAGRGRLGRQWIAPAGTSLLMSLVFRPEVAPAQVAVGVDQFKNRRRLAHTDVIQHPQRADDDATQHQPLQADVRPQLRQEIGAFLGAKPAQAAPPHE